LTCAGWYKNGGFDEPYGIVANNAVTVKDKGSNLSRELLYKGSPLELSGKLHSCLFQQDRPLLTGVEMVITLHRAKTSIAFCAATEAELPIVEIRNPRLKLWRIDPTPVFLSTVAKTLLTRTVKYHIERVSMRSLTLSPGVQHTLWCNLTIGQLPKTAIVGIISNSSYAGSIHKSPFEFQHYRLSNISCEIDGILYPSRGYSMDFDSNYSLSAYEGLMDCMERLNEPSGEMSFDRFQYNNGYTLYGFDFTPSHTGRGALSLVRNGNLNVNFRLKVPLPETVVVVAMLCFDNIIEIDNSRRVQFDYTP
jgi:hypothetical protein